MELELSLGNSPAPVKCTSTPVLTPTQAGKEYHELLLELGVGTARRTGQDNQRTPTQPGEDEDDGEACFCIESPVELSLGCRLLPASAETGTQQIICAN